MEPTLSSLNHQPRESESRLCPPLNIPLLSWGMDTNNLRSIRCRACRLPCSPFLAWITLCSPPCLEVSYISTSRSIILSVASYQCFVGVIGTFASVQVSAYGAVGPRIEDHFIVCRRPCSRIVIIIHHMSTEKVILLLD